MRKLILFRLLFGVTLSFGLCFPGKLMAQKTKSKQRTKHASKVSAKPKVKKTLYGLASYYHPKFHGRKTANGQIFDQRKLTAACNVLPFGTRVKVTNLRNGKTVIVRVNDRLNKKTRRLIDLTHQAASNLGFLKRGLTRVKLEVLN